MRNALHQKSLVACHLRLRTGAARKRVHPWRGVLQGCPLSCFFIALYMLVWYHTVSAVVGVCVRIFVDDRILWSRLQPHR